MTRRPCLVAGLTVLLACAGERAVEAPLQEMPIVRADAGVSLGAVTPPIEPRPEPSALVGRWEGLGRQRSGSSWKMLVDIRTTERGVCAVVDYPSLGCRAEWECQGETDGSLRAEEHLVDDRAHRCVDGGEMTMRARGDTLEWTWTSPDDDASATLKRRTSK